MVELKIQRISDVKMPSYAHEGDAGMDLYASHDDLIKAGNKKVIKTGLCVAIPQGYVGLIWDKSGIAVKHSVHNLAGVIDSGYRGEIGIVMINLGKEDFKVTKNKRIAQLLIQPITHAKIMEVDSLNKTSRNEGGFGSTGTH